MRKEIEDGYSGEKKKNEGKKLKRIVEDSISPVNFFTDQSID